jgi:ATP-dependent helicase/nuclease subunit B
VRSLARICERHRIARKLVVAPTMSVGRELLRRLALAGHGWIGCEIVTPRPLALRLARPAMERSETTLLDTFETRALLDEAMDAALADATGAFAGLADGIGFRERAQGAVEALRLAGLESKELDRAKLHDRAKKAFLARMLRKYEQLLVARRRMDTADVVRLALAAMEESGSSLPPTLEADIVVLVPGLGTRGLTGKLIASLVARGAKLLDSEPVHGLETPPKFLWKLTKDPGPGSFLHAPADAPTELPLAADFFRAASVHDELREVLRRVVEKGLPWDQVEIVTPDPETYGSALHALATRLGVPVTFAVGLPIGRTRVGRVVRSYLDWIAEGFQADPIRRLLEAGDLRPHRSRGHHSASALARRFRALRVGWGRTRYRAQIREALESVERIEAGRYESEESLRRRRARTRSELEALRSILFPTLRATPSVPDRMTGAAAEAGARVSPSELAKGLRAFLRRVPRGQGSERAAREEVDRVLERVEATLTRRTAFVSAVTALRRHLELRVRGDASFPVGADGGAPWASEGGHLHLTDLQHGGYAGRAETFFVGWDVERAGGDQSQDPMLLDADRRVLGGDMPTSLDLLHEREFSRAALFARSGARITLSFCAWDASSARASAPSPILLRVLRASRRDPTLSFRDLETALGRVVCSVPSSARAAIDVDDAWMAAIGGSGMLYASTELVAEGFPALRNGLAARQALTGEPGPHHGVVTPRPDLHDPRRNPSLVISASRLQELGRCPLSYLHTSVLEIRPPDDPELDPDRWLNPLQAGELLHRVYDTTLREAKSRMIPAADEAFESLALDALARSIQRALAEVPVPGEGALSRQTSQLRSDVRSYVRMIRKRGAPWVALELRFGLAGEEPALIEIPGGMLRLRGAIDRIDEDLRGLTVIDYKTGVPRDFADTGTFHGGRRLQHGLYTLVAESKLNASVVSGEFHFPTMRGQNEVMQFDRLRLEGVRALLGTLLDGVAAGAFLPTDDADDCRFCNFAEVCRAHETGYGSVTSPLAAWSEEQANAALWPAFMQFKRARTFER